MWFNGSMTNDFALSPADQDLLFREARTANAFTDEPVTDEQLQAIFDLAKWGPTHMNAQPLRVVAVRSPEKRAQLVEAMMGSNQPKTLAAPLTLVFAFDQDYHEALTTQFPALPAARDMHASMGREGRSRAGIISASLQIGYWIMAIRAAGLAVGPMGGFDPEAVDKLLFPDGVSKSLVIANVGHGDPASYYPRGPRLGFDEVITTV